MREIKFRAFIDCEMIDGDSLAFEQYLPVSQLLTNCENLMQYTGLKDKNGTDICEGDIVKVPNRKLKAKKEPTYITEIIWRTHGFTLKHNDTYFNDFACIWKGVEVIGNIHQHPNLLPCKS